MSLFSKFLNDSELYHSFVALNLKLINLNALGLAELQPRDTP